MNKALKLLLLCSFLMISGTITNSHATNDDENFDEVGDAIEGDILTIDESSKMINNETIPNDLDLIKKIKDTLKKRHSKKI